MNLSMGQWTVGLERDKLIKLRDAKGMRISCLDGALWVTQEKSAADVVLEAGQSLVIGRPGLTLVMALRPSTLQLHARTSRLPPLRRTLAGWLRPGRLRPSGVH